MAASSMIFIFSGSTGCSVNFLMILLVMILVIVSMLFFLFEAQKYGELL